MNETEIQYGTDPAEVMTIYHAPGCGLRPFLLWSWGGGFTNYGVPTLDPFTDPWDAILASGYSIVVVGYPLAPGMTFPSQILSIQKAYARIKSNPRPLKLHPATFITGGKSSGATLQLSAALGRIADDDHAGFPALEPRGVICWQGLTDFTATKANNSVPTIWQYFGKAQKKNIPVTELLAAGVVDVLNANLEVASSMPSILMHYPVGVPKSPPIANVHAVSYGQFLINAMDRKGGITELHQDPEPFGSSFVLPWIQALL